MSIFSLPRLHVSGLIEINVGTANNDDYSGLVFTDDPGQGQPVRLADTAAVRATTFGQSDADFVTWAQRVVGATNPPAPTASTPAPNKGLLPATPATPPAAPPAPPPPKQILPAEWNYYGDMGLTMRDVVVTAVDYDDRSVRAGDAAAATDPFVGATLSFDNRPDGTGRSTGMICDVTPEDVPLSQMIAGTLMLARNGQALFAGQPHKAITRFINFQRNVNLTASAGAAAAFQHAVPLSALAGQPILGYLPAKDASGRALAGLVFRYVLYRTIPPINPSRSGSTDAYNAALIALYAKQGLNPGIAQLSGTIAPWYEGDMATVPAGRLLVATSTTITPPPNTRGNGPAFALAPATLVVDTARAGGPWAVIDTAGCFPEWYQGHFDPTQQTDNAKLDFGAVRLTLHGAQQVHDLGPIPYTDAEYAARDGIFDVSLAGVPADDVANGSFAITGAAGDYLLEQEYFIASDQAGVYAEQPLGPRIPIDRFNNEGDSVPVTFRVFRRGVEVAPGAASGLALAVWEYDSTPNQQPGPRTRILPDLAPGDPLTIVPGTPGNRVYTVTLPGAPPPPDAYGDFQGQLMTAPLVCLRILPNDRDYSAYFDATQPQPVGTAALTFEVLYEEVLRNYYLLYPAMSQRVPLNDPSYWADPQMAIAMLQRTQVSWWMRPEYMPRTRDLSVSRRTLLQAWCRKIMAGGSTGVVA